MPSTEHRTSPEQMPPLEPLSDPSSELSSLHDRSPQPPLSGSTTPPSPSPSTKRRPQIDMRQLVKELTVPSNFSLVLENKGNVARDHLASERTYLAYVRTSLATASAGVALVQLLTLTPKGGSIELMKFAKPLGATIILFGIVILILGVFRYFLTQSALVRGYFPVARKSITAVAFILASLVVVVFGVVVAGTKG